MQAVKLLRQFGTVTAGVAALTVGIIGNAQAVSFVSFEDAPSLGLSDNQSITDQYLSSGFSFGLDNDLDGIADTNITPALERTGNDNKSGFVNAGSGKDVAEAYWFLHTQPKNCWTFEFEVRPWQEKAWFNSTSINSKM